MTKAKVEISAMASAAVMPTNLAIVMDLAVHRIKEARRVRYIFWITCSKHGTTEP